MNSLVFYTIVALHSGVEDQGYPWCLPAIFPYPEACAFHSFPFACHVNAVYVFSWLYLSKAVDSEMWH